MQNLRRRTGEGPEIFSFEQVPGDDDDDDGLQPHFEWQDPS